MHRLRLRMFLMFFALLSMTTVTGCRSANVWEDEGDGSPSRAFVLVKNNNFSGMDIYAVGDGLATRIGTVSGGSSRRYVLSESLTRSQNLTIVGTPVGGNGRASTGLIRPAAGQTVYFTIQSVLSQSTVTIE